MLIYRLPFSPFGVFILNDNMLGSVEPGFKFSLNCLSSSSFVGLTLSLGPSLTNLKCATSKSILLRLGMKRSPLGVCFEGVFDREFGVLQCDFGVFLGVLGIKLEVGVLIMVGSASLLQFFSILRGSAAGFLCETGVDGSKIDAPSRDCKNIVIF